MRRSFVCFVVALVLVWGSTASAQPKIEASQHIQMAEYERLLDDYGWLGCFTGAGVGGWATVATAASYPIFFLSITSLGCQLGGGLLAPVGLIVRDYVTGDNAFQRYLKGFIEELEKQAAKQGQRPQPPQGFREANAASGETLN